MSSEVIPVSSSGWLWHRIQWVLVGAASVHYVKLIWNLFARNNSSSAAPEDLKVYGFCPLNGDPDISPACIKLITILRMSDIHYRYVPVKEHKLIGSPKQKVPWVHWRRLNAGNPMGDSHLIMQALVQQNLSADLDAWLTEDQRAVATAFRVMLEQSVYFAGVHQRWCTPDFWRVTCDLYFHTLLGIPRPFHALAAIAARWSVARAQWAQGTGRHTDAEICARAADEVRAVSRYLGGKPYLMGERPCTADAAVYAAWCLLTQGDWDSDLRRDVEADCANLEAHARRIRREFFQDLAAPAGGVRPALPPLPPETEL